MGRYQGGGGGQVERVPGRGSRGVRQGGLKAGDRICENQSRASRRRGGCQGEAQGASLEVLRQSFPAGPIGRGVQGEEKSATLAGRELKFALQAPKEAPDQADYQRAQGKAGIELHHRASHTGCGLCGGGYDSKTQAIDAARAAVAPSLGFGRDCGRSFSCDFFVRTTGENSAARVHFTQMTSVEPRCCHPELQAAQDRHAGRGGGFAMSDMQLDRKVDGSLEPRLHDGPAAASECACGTAQCRSVEASGPARDPASAAASQARFEAEASLSPCGPGFKLSLEAVDPVTGRGHFLRLEHKAKPSQFRRDEPEFSTRSECERFVVNAQDIVCRRPLPVKSVFPSQTQGLGVGKPARHIHIFEPCESSFFGASAHTLGPGLGCIFAPQQAMVRRKEVSP